MIYLICNWGNKLKTTVRNFLVVQRLRLYPNEGGTWALSLVRELDPIHQTVS